MFYFFLERGEGREKERERNINVWLPLERPPLGICPDWESNWPPFGSQPILSPTEPHQPGHKYFYDVSYEVTFGAQLSLHKKGNLKTW